MEDNQFDLKLKGVMEFYVKTYFESKEESMKKVARENSYFVDPEVVDMQVKDYLNAVTAEVTEKFHNIGMLILDGITSGNEYAIREFEVLFIDLLKRTLLKDMKERKSVQPIVIIADPNAKSEEPNA
jgi:hypothetical protein